MAKQCKHYNITTAIQIEKPSRDVPGVPVYGISVTAKCDDCGVDFAFPNKKGEPVTPLKMPMKPIIDYNKVKDLTRDPLKSKPLVGVPKPPPGYGVNTEEY